MSELKKKINYTVVCVNEFADRYHLSPKEAFVYSRVRNEPSASSLAFGDCAWVKYPAPWSELDKKKPSHAP